MMSLNHLDLIIYINLDHRKDKKNSIIKNLKKLPYNKKVKRISAYYHPLNGTKACALSHIQALKYAKDIKAKNVLILEDDCIFLKEKKINSKYLEDFFKNFKNNWDVFFLGTYVLSYKKTICPSILKVKKSLCSHAYMVNNHYFSNLIDCFQKAYNDMKKDLFFVFSYEKAIDRRWHKLQKKDRWYIGKNFIAQQGNFYSDIELKNKNRKHSITK